MATHRGATVAFRPDKPMIVASMKFVPPSYQKRNARFQRACLSRGETVHSIAPANSFILGGSMKLKFRRTLDFALILLCSAVLAYPQDVFTQNHVVSSADLQKDLAAASTARENNLARVDKFFSSEQAQQALKTAHVDIQEVKNAVRLLNDDDLARLTSRTDKAQKDFAAGNLSDRDLIVIILLVVALVLIIVAVRA
jgi:hypothetical protein